ncbi:MAG: hypothetical protein KBE24_04945 [Fusobacteriaceae bacterium]|nr:hypothetical protein [Fusobacteriaceae bacterium]
MENEIKILKDFVEGTLSCKDFEQEMYNNKKLEKLLSDQTVNWYGTHFHESNPYLVLLERSYNNANGRLNAQEDARLFLEKMNIEINPTNKYLEAYDLLLTASPKYLDIDPDFFEKNILPIDKSLSKAEKKAEIKKNIEQLFKYQTKPPQWIQNPDWPIKKNKPLFFLGQVAIKNCNLFHDNGAVYLFVDTETTNIETITQLY